MISIENIFSYTGRIFDTDLHLARLKSISRGVGALLQADTLAIAAIGRALGEVQGIKAKSGIKQIDRLLSNNGFDLEQYFFKKWVRYLVGQREKIVVAMDWTDFDKDGHSTLAIHLITRHGRASALVWKTFSKKDLKGNRNDFEDEVLVLLKNCLPENVRATVLADRGFGDVKLYAFLRELGFDFVIRFKGNTKIKSQNQIKKAKSWLLTTGEALKLTGVHVTGEGYYLPAFVCVHDIKMKDAWFLAVSDTELTASEAVKLYGRRFSIEEKFRDIKDPHFGMGLSQTRISSTRRRDRILMLCAIATTLLTLLGAAGESIGLDRGMKANTSKARSHSLLNQGGHYLRCIPNMRREDELNRLMEKYRELLCEHEAFSGIFGYV